MDDIEGYDLTITSQDLLENWNSDDEESENEESKNKESEDGSGSEGEPESEGGSEPELRSEEMLEGDSDEIPPLEGGEIYVLYIVADGHLGSAI